MILVIDAFPDLLDMLDVVPSLLVAPLIAKQYGPDSVPADIDSAIANATATGTDATSETSLEKKDTAYSSVTRIRAKLAICDRAGPAPTLVQMMCFMRSVEALLWRLYSSPDLSHKLKPDTGLDKLLVDHSSEKLLIREGTSDIVLNYIGKITRVPTVTSLLLCEMWGESFFVEGSGHRSPLSPDWVPAWSVPLAKPIAPESVSSGPKKKKPKVPPAVRLEMQKCAPIQFAFKYTHGGVDVTDIAMLQLHQLVLPAGSVVSGVGSAALPIPLVRAAEGDLFTPVKEVAKPTAVNKLSSLMDGMLPPPAAVSSVVPSGWEFAKHLFR